MLERMQRHLELDAGQVEAIRPLLEQAGAQREALSGERLTRDERHARHEAIRQRAEAAIRAQLRPEQLARFDAHRARVAARHPGDHAAPGGHRPGAEQHLSRLRTELGLDAEQVARVRPLVEAAHAAHEAVAAEPLTMDEVHARHRAILDDTRARIRALLRPDQAARFDAMRHGPGDHPGHGSRRGHGLRRTADADGI